jgi:hypothetical protein
VLASRSRRGGRGRLGREPPLGLFERPAVDPGVVVEVAIEEAVNQLEVLLLPEQLDAFARKLRCERERGADSAARRCDRSASSF